MGNQRNSPPPRRTQKRKTRRKRKRSVCPMNHRLFLPLAPFSCQFLLPGNRMHPPLGLASPGCQASREDAFPSPPHLTRTAVSTLQHCSPPHPSRSLPPSSGKGDKPQHERDTSPKGTQHPWLPPAAKRARNWGSLKLPGASTSSTGSGFSPFPPCPLPPHDIIAN